MRTAALLGHLLGMMKTNDLRNVEALVAKQAYYGGFNRDGFGYRGGRRYRGKKRKLRVRLQRATGPGSYDYENWIVGALQEGDFKKAHSMAVQHFRQLKPVVRRHVKWTPNTVKALAAANGITL